MTNYANNNGLSDYSVFDVYNLAMYFCAMTLTSVGYGDIYPWGRFEVTLASVTMFITENTLKNMKLNGMIAEKKLNVPCVLCSTAVTSPLCDVSQNLQEW